MDQIVLIAIEALLMFLGEFLSLKYSPTSLASKRAAEDAIVCCALAFVLGIASVYFLPTLALRDPVWQWLNAFISPLVAAALIVLLRRKVKIGATRLPQPSERAVLFQAFGVGLVFNLSRLLFGH